MFHSLLFYPSISILNVIFILTKKYIDTTLFPCIGTFLILDISRVYIIVWSNISYARLYQCSPTHALMWKHRATCNYVYTSFDYNFRCLFFYISFLFQLLVCTTAVFALKSHNIYHLWFSIQWSITLPNQFNIEGDFIFTLVLCRYITVDYSHVTWILTLRHLYLSSIQYNRSYIFGLKFIIFSSILLFITNPTSRSRFLTVLYSIPV